MKHNLKILPEYYQAVIDGSKTFEIRKNDRNFQVGDVLILNEFKERYSGRWVAVKVTYILKSKEYLPKNYVAMSIRKCEYGEC
jgi:ASC-1-like (ASCH) protein